MLQFDCQPTVCHFIAFLDIFYKSVGGLAESFKLDAPTHIAVFFLGCVQTQGDPDLAPLVSVHKKKEKAKSHVFFLQENAFCLPLHA